MRPAAAPSAPSTSSSSSSMNKPRLSRDQLRRRLEIVGSLGTPLPSELPSPPASRSTSPMPSGAVKRKHPHAKSNSESKRPRIDRPAEAVASSSRQPASLPAKPEPSIHHDALPSSTSAPPNAVPAPVQRPRRTPRRQPADFAVMHDKYHEQGRAFKYSGDARHFSTYSPSSKEFRALEDPPPQGSPYQRFATGIARLEHLNAFLCFLYAMLCKDEERGSVLLDSWRTLHGYTEFCRHKFSSPDVTTDRERAFLGLISLAESFINARMAQQLIKSKLRFDVKGMIADVQSQIALVSTQPPQTDASTPITSVRSQATPPMLPSPATTNTANSANSTPTATATPSAAPSQAAPPTAHAFAELIPKELLPNGQPLPRAADSITTSATPSQAVSIRNLVNWLEAAQTKAVDAQRLLTLPILARHFPHTFARVTQTSLGAHEEFEPDLEDDACELFWPAQAVAGNGLGWVILLGTAMLREFGRDYEYRGIEGVVPKPRDARARR